MKNKKLIILIVLSLSIPFMIAATKIKQTVDNQPIVILQNIIGNAGTFSPIPGDEDSSSEVSVQDTDNTEATEVHDYTTVPYIPDTQIEVQHDESKIVIHVYIKNISINGNRYGFDDLKGFLLENYDDKKELLIRDDFADYSTMVHVRRIAEEVAKKKIRIVSDYGDEE